MEQFKKLIVGAVALTAMGVTALAIANQEAIAERLQSDAKVCMAGEDCAGGATQVAASDGARDPEEIYQGKCSTCHAQGVGGAPKLEASAWQPRVDEKGMDKIYQNAWDGIGAMPPKGICMDCSKEELNATVDYMLEEAGVSE